jgi:hypothetical protein
MSHFRGYYFIMLIFKRVKRKYHREPDLKRIKRKVIHFNSKELTAIEAYCQRYRVMNKSQFMRETIITAVLKKFDEDYPTLWDDQQLKLFSNY